MKAQFLFPNKMKPLGWGLFFPSFVLGVFNMYSEFQFDFLQISRLSDNLLMSSSQNLTDEVALVGVILGLMIIGFSKLKIEDEYSQKIRLESLLWATYLNFALILISTLFVYGDLYFDVLIYNLFTLPLFFVIRFHFYLIKK